MTLDDQNNIVFVKIESQDQAHVPTHELKGKKKVDFMRKPT